MAHRTQGLDADTDLYADGSNLRGYKPESAPAADDATYFTAESGNMLQEELCNAITAGNVNVATDASTDRANGWAQLAKAIFDNKAITDSAIADKTIKAAQIALSTIIGANIANNTITGDKIVLDDTLFVSQDQFLKLGVDLRPGQALEYQSISGAGGTNGINVRDKGITENMLNDNAVTAAKIADRTITQDQIALPAISEDHLFDNAVGYGKISPNAVGYVSLREGLGQLDDLRRTTAPGPGQVFADPYVSKIDVETNTAYEISFTYTNPTSSGPLPTIDHVDIKQKATGGSEANITQFVFNKTCANNDAFSGSFVLQTDSTALDYLKVKAYITGTQNGAALRVNFRKLNSFETVTSS